MTRVKTAMVVLSAMTIASCSGPARRALAIGSPAPAFSLPGIDGATHTLAEYGSSPVLVLVATCNHCPAAQLYEHRIKQLDDDYRAKGVAVVAFSPDHPSALPLSQLAYSDVGDTLADMKARASQRGYRFPYLYDGDEQALATALASAANLRTKPRVVAARTPDGELVISGHGTGTGQPIADGDHWHVGLSHRNIRQR